MELLRLKEVLQGRGMSGKDLAEKVGVTPVGISNLVQNKSFPKPELLLKIAEALQVDVRELLNPTRGGALLNGFVEFEGQVYTIRTGEDLQELLQKVQASRG